MIPRHGKNEILETLSLARDFLEINHYQCLCVVHKNIFCEYHDAMDKLVSSLHRLGYAPSWYKSNTTKKDNDYDI